MLAVVAGEFMDDAINIESEKSAALEQLLVRAREMAPRLRERAADAERTRRVPEETIQELVAAGFPRICQPARFGGFELGWDAVCAVAMVLGKGCASQAWVSNVYSEHGCVAALFPDEAQHEVWDDDPEILISSSYGPTGEVQTVDGGVRVSGRYHFSSGVEYARWSIIGGLVPQPDKLPYPAFMLIPAADRRIIDNWHVVGMAGTGSADFEVNDVFVPAHRILDENLIFAGRTPGAEVNKAPVYRMPQKGISQLALASAPIGAAEGAVDDFADMLRTKTVRGQALASAQNMHLRLAESAADAEAARRIVLGTSRDIMAKLASGADTDDIDMATATRDAGYGLKLAQRATTRLFEAAGGSGMYLTNHLQRVFRDVYAAGGHLGLGWDRCATMYSRLRLGRGISGFFPGR